MSSDGPKNGYAFVIDTDSYAGNFEREMTAYLTGVVGECEVGKELIEGLPIDFNNIMQVSDDNGCYRPTTCWLNPEKTSYDSVAIFFEEKPTDEQISFMKERVKNFDNIHRTKGYMAKFNTGRPEIKILGFRLIEFISKNKEQSV